MARINPVQNPDSNAAPLLDAVQKKFGMVPNILGTMGHSAATLGAYLSFGEALGKAKISPQLREQIALAVAGVNGCGYCASAHTAIGKGAGLSEGDLRKALDGQASDPKAQSALQFARAIVEKRGWVSDEDVKAFRSAGFGDAELTEVVATVAMNIFTNYFNHVAQTAIDFPEVRVAQPAGV